MNGPATIAPNHTKKRFCCDLADNNAGKTPGYTDLMNTPITDAELRQDDNRCMKLLLLMKKKM
jgi:hypothetical protein